MGAPAEIGPSPPERGRRATPCPCSFPPTLPTQSPGPDGREPRLRPLGTAAQGTKARRRRPAPSTVSRPGPAHSRPAGPITTPAPTAGPMGSRSEHPPRPHRPAGCELEPTLLPVSVDWHAGSLILASKMIVPTESDRAASGAIVQPTLPAPAASGPGSRGTGPTGSAALSRGESEETSCPLAITGRVPMPLERTAPMGRHPLAPPPADQLPGAPLVSGPARARPTPSHQRSTVARRAHRPNRADASHPQATCPMAMARSPKRAPATLL